MTRYTGKDGRGTNSGRRCRGRLTGGRRAVMAAALAAGAAMMLPHNARAEDRWYVGPDGGSWTDVSLQNWSDTEGGLAGKGTPGGGDVVYVKHNDAASRTVIYDYTGPAVNLASLTIENTGGGMSGLSQAANNLSTSGNQTIGDTGLGAYTQFGGTNNVGDTLILGKSVGGSGSYTLSAGTITLNNTAGNAFYGPLWVGGYGNAGLSIQGVSTLYCPGNAEIGLRSGSNGAVVQSGGTVTIGDNVSPRTLFIGRESGSTGSYTINQTSGTASLTAYGSMNIGYDGNGSFTHSAGTVLVQAVGANSGVLEIAANPGSTGSYTMTGGSLTVSGSYAQIDIGGNAGGAGGNGSMAINGGVVNALNVQTWASGSLSVGGGTLSTTYNVTHGTATLNSGTINCSQQLSVIGAASSFTQNGGTVNLPDGQSPGAILFMHSGGTYTINAGTINTPALDVGGLTAPAGLGTLNVNGGTINISSVLEIETTGTVNLNGGIINTPNLVNNGQMNVGAGVYNVSGLIMGSGTFTQTSGASTLADGTNLNSGTFQINGGTATASGALKVGVTAVDPTNPNNTVTGNATLNISSGTLSADTLIFGDASGGSGEGNFSGDANVIVGGGLTTNSVTVSGNAHLTILDQDPPAGEDPVLNRSIVGGYLRDGAVHVHGGTVTSPKMKLGLTSGKTGTYTQDGGAVSLGILAAGNDADMNSGSGTGTIGVSGGTLYADTVLLGSTAGGSGDMTVSGTAVVTVGGGFTLNDLTVNGGSVTVLDQNPPAGEDAVLNRSMVGGYLRDGAMHMHGGTVTTPKIKLGVTSGRTGTYTQDAGTVNVTTMGVGNDADVSSGSGAGNATVSGGTLTATNALIGSSAGGTGNMTWSGGTLSVANMSIVAGGSMTVSARGGGPRKLMRLSSLSMDDLSGAKLDINDNDLVVDYTGSTPFTWLRQYVADGHSGTHGIISTAGSNWGSSTTLALVDNNDPLVGGAYTQWPPGSGQTIDATTVIGKYTYIGDVDLDGQVGTSDYLILDTNRGQTGLSLAGSWIKGDVDRDGAVGTSDYLLLDTYRGSGAGNPLGPATVQLVPEPGVAGVIGVAMLMRRKRRWRMEGGSKRWVVH